MAKSCQTLLHRAVVGTHQSPISTRISRDEKPLGVDQRGFFDDAKRVSKIEVDFFGWSKRFVIYSHCIPIVFPLYSHCIPIVFPFFGGTSHRETHGVTASLARAEVPESGRNVRTRSAARRRWRRSDSATSPSYSSKRQPLDLPSCGISSCSINHPKLSISNDEFFGWICRIFCVPI